MKGTNPLKRNLATGKATIGSWLQINSPMVTEIMAGAGFDWLTVDMEHSPITLDTAQQMIQVIGARGSVPLVRVGENRPLLIRQALDAGAAGVIVPMVNSEEEARSAVAAATYPPEGRRGVGIARAHGYGRDFDGYLGWARENTVVIVQVEHIDAVRNLDAILSVKGIDGAIIGPYDLSGSLDLPGKFEDPRVSRAVRQVEETCRNRKIPLGIHVIEPDPARVAEYLRRGYGFVAFSGDMLLLEWISRTQVQRLKEMTGW
jgi:2-dehydro-3-deoxyglucarate aldolase